MIAVKRNVMLQDIKEKGFSLVRGAIDRGSVKNVRQLVVDLMQQKGWAVNPDGTASSVGYKIGSRHFIDVLGSAMKIESLHELCSEAIIQKTADQLLGCIQGVCCA